MLVGVVGGGVGVSVGAGVGCVGVGCVGVGGVGGGGRHGCGDGGCGARAVCDHTKAIAFIGQGTGRTLGVLMLDRKNPFEASEEENVTTKIVYGVGQW